MFTECDSRLCPAQVKGYYGKDHLILGFCCHHFFQYEESITKQGWLPVAADKELVQDSRYKKKKV